MVGCGFQGALYRVYIVLTYPERGQRAQGISLANDASCRKYPMVISAGL